MTLHGPVLVGTDLSRIAAEAVQQGADLAAALHTRLLICHVIPELRPDLALFGRSKAGEAQVDPAVLASARAAVEAHVSGILKTGGTPLEIVLAHGTPHVGLLSAAEKTGAGTIVLGSGPEALDVVRHASGAVLVASPSPAGPVIGATDFSGPSLPALEIAAAEARRRGAPLHLVHAWDMNVFGEQRAPAAAMPYLEGKSWIALEGLDELQQEARRRLEAALREAAVPGEVAIISGPASEVILQYAEKVGASLIVMGTHGRSGFKRLTLGSTAARVIEREPCSVLVVRVTPA